MRQSQNYLTLNCSNLEVSVYGKAVGLSVASPVLCTNLICSRYLLQYNIEVDVAVGIFFSVVHKFMLQSVSSI